MVDFIAQRHWGNQDGMDRVMWGTDWPCGHLTQLIGEVRALDIPEEAKTKILGTNAIRILRLPVRLET